MPEAMGLPLLQAREPEFGLLLLWLLFILIPIVGRIVGRIVRKLTPDGAASADPRAAREERLRRAREVQKQGEDLWRRLMQGEEAEEDRASPEPVAEPPQPVASVETFEERPASPEPSLAAPISRARPRPERSRPRIAEPLPRAPSGLPSEEPLPSLPETLSDVLPSSVGAEAFDEDLGGLGEDLTRADVARAPGVGDAAFALKGRADLVRAIVWSEILGPPVSQREPGLPGGS